MYHRRIVSHRLKRMVEHFPAVVIGGARQVGKSTLLKHQFGDSADYVEFDPVIDIENARQDPDLFLRNHSRRLILDEIQYAPEVAAAIKRQIDRDKSPGQYLISGSQQWSVMQKLADSLAGRVVFVDLDSFTVSETRGESIDPWIPRWLEHPHTPPAARIIPRYALYEQMWRGFFPEVQFLPLDLVRPYFLSYERTYVDRDIRQMADFADIHVFGRFFRLLGALTAQEINFNQLGRDIGITPQTARRWLSLMTATFQWHEIPAYATNSVKRISSKPKGYLSDTGLAVFTQAISAPGVIPNNPLWGALFETCVVNEVRKQLSAMGSAVNLYHWRSHGGAEVDLLLETNGIFHPVEIKAKSNPGKQDARGINAFRKTYPSLHIGTGLILCASESTYPVSENIFAVPWDASY